MLILTLSEKVLSFQEELCQGGKKQDRKKDKIEDSLYIYYRTKHLQIRRAETQRLKPFETLSQNKCSGYFYVYYQASISACPVG